MKHFIILLITLLISIKPIFANNSDEEFENSEDSQTKINTLLNVQIDEIEENVKQLSGEIEKANHQTEESNSKLDKFIADAEFRLQENETKLKSISEELAAQSALIKANEAKINQILNQGVEKQYHAAMADFEKNELKSSLTKFQKFIKEHPESTLVANANFWIAEIHFKQKNHTKALEQFINTQKTFPKNNKSEEIHLKIAMCLGNLQKTTKACEAFDKLIAKQPKDAILKQAKQEQEKLKCVAKKKKT